ncbi:MAG TPA: hypothetical protein PLO61_06800 [Fimbriimonadaceae bacterium]|nr:hypothetical protein [Fimbriimonadaceae bacterium]HRJ33199.1 hypothetical protein [Fimbriimonadaceae bacterium]
MSKPKSKSSASSSRSRIARKPAAKRARRPISWRAWLWVALTVNVAAGLAWSPATSASKIRVLGAPPEDQNRIRQVLQSLRQVPSVRVDQARLESTIQSGSAIDQAKFDLNLFGRGILRIRSKIPVGVVVADYPLLLSDQGDLFTTTTISPDLPKIQVLEGAGLNLSVTAGWETGRVADLCQWVSSDLPPGSWKIRVQSGGRLGLNKEKGGVVTLGDSSNLQQKIRVLKQILQDQPEILNEVKEINLTAPSQPALRR